MTFLYLFTAFMCACTAVFIATISPVESIFFVAGFAYWLNAYINRKRDGK